MLSINYIQNYLTDDQVKIDDIHYKKLNLFERKQINSIKNIINSNNIISEIDNKTDKLENYCEYLHTCFDIIFNKNIEEYYYNNRLFKNKSPVFTFINSILNIGNNFFNLYDEKNREQLVKNLIKKMDDDLFEKNLYNKFKYSKNRKFNKADIQTVLKNSFQFKNVEKFELLKQYISDYLGINIYIININYSVINFEKSEYYFTKRFSNNTDNYIKFLPSFVVIYENEIYKPVLSKNNSIFTFSSDSEIINKLWKYLNIDEQNKVEQNINKNNIFNQYCTSNISEDEKINESIETINTIKNSKYKNNYLKNLKINDIQKLCEENNILLQKKSEKTLKMINKLKNELIDELLLLVE
jgi:hypothetical protein